MTAMTNTIARELEGRLDAVAWGLFFIVSGAVALLPGLPEGTWLVSVGAILVGLSAVRAALRLTVSGFVVILGSVLIASGAGELAGVDVPGFALFLVLCGLALVSGEIVRRQRA